MMIKLAKRETIWLNRRSFLRRSLVAAGGLGVLGGIAPNLILNPAYAGTVVIVDSSGDKRISISNGSFARPFDVGTWSRLRVGMRFGFVGSASLTSLNPTLAVGLCAGSSNQVFDATTTNYLGLRTRVATWTFLDSTPDRYTPSGSSSGGSKRVGSSWTDGTAYVTAVIFPAESVVDPPMLIIDITKGSPNYTVDSFMPTAAGGTSTRDQFLTQIIAVTPTLANHALDVSGNTIAFDEVAGTLNHVQIGWDRFEATLEISDIAVVKMAA